MTVPTLRDWLREGPFTLAMSAGFFGFFAHSGVLRALEQAKLLPDGVSGASAGALVGGLWASGLDSQQLIDELVTLRRADFWDPAPGFGLLRGRRFRAHLDELLPVRDFASCRVPTVLSVYDVLSRRTRVLRSGPLAPAIQASCTLPGLFQPLWHEGRPLLDGGILDRAGLDGVAPGTRVLHHHLASRSPWRKRGSAAVEPPRRDGLVALVIEDLPRSGPFKLERGVHALYAARRAAEHALSQPISQGLVRVSAGSRGRE